MPFVHPPRGIPIESYDSEESPIVQARVCDDCHDQVTGTRAPRPARVVAEKQRVEKLDFSVPAHLVRQCSLSSWNASSEASGSSQDDKKAGSESKKKSEPEISYGGLETYPLRVHSSICKRNGGGRWVPKPIVHWAGHKMPWGKAQYEIEMEKEEEAERIRQSNPIRGNGSKFISLLYGLPELISSSSVIKMRTPREPPPLIPPPPVSRSTF